MSSTTPFPPDAAGEPGDPAEGEVPTREVDGEEVLDTDIDDDLVNSADADAVAATDEEQP